MQIQASEDTYLHDNNATSNYATANTIYCGLVLGPPPMFGADTYTGLLRFDISTLDVDFIDKVELELKNGSGFECGIYQLYKIGLLMRLIGMFMPLDLLGIQQEPEGKELTIQQQTPHF